MLRSGHFGISVLGSREREEMETVRVGGREITSLFDWPSLSDTVLPRINVELSKMQAERQPVNANLIQVSQEGCVDQIQGP